MTPSIKRNINTSTSRSNISLSGYHLNHGTKMAMQSLYRNQLDEMVTEKKKQKDYEK